MLAVQSAGQGIPLILLHAFPLSSAMWRAELQVFQRTARVVAPDLPGFGGSARQATPSIPEAASQVATLLDHLGMEEPVMLGGLSMGGYVALEFFRQFPGRVRGLGLFSTRAVPDTPEGRKNRLKAVEKIRAEGLKPFAESILFKLLGKTTLESQSGRVEQVTRMILSGSAEGVTDALLAMADRRDSTDLLKGISCPTLVVAGDEDAFIPVAETERMASQIRRAEFAVVRKAGHLVNLEQPELFQGILERFLRSQFATGV